MPGFQAPVFASNDSCFGIRAVQVTVGGPLTLISNLIDGGIEARSGVGDGGFLAPVAYPTDVPATRGLVAGDFNLDGFTDIAVATENGIAVLLSPDGRTFGAPKLTAVGADTPIYRLALADLNGDGYPDLIGTGGSTNCGGASTGGRSPVVFWNDCQGGFASVGYIGASLPNPECVGAVLQTGADTPSILIGDLCANEFDLIPSESAGAP